MILKNSIKVGTQCLDPITQFKCAYYYSIDKKEEGGNIAKAGFQENVLEICMVNIFY